ncbi:MAG: carbon-nitrogen hydrolase [Planctomycetota bacterium]
MTSAAPLRIALLQHACGPEPAANTDTCVDMIRDAAGQGAQLIVTQELFRGIYFCITEDDRHFALAEPIPGPTTQRLGELAKELKVSISASLFERRAPGLYHNTSVLIGPAGDIVGTYRKMHIPDDPGYYEKYYFTPGDLGFSAHPMPDQPSDSGRVGMLVCWDQWFPEAARLTALHGAELLLYPTAIGWYTSEPDDERTAQRDAWTTIQRSHAIANGVFVAACNRIGTEPNPEADHDTVFWGSSFVCDPMGRVIAEASTDQQEVLLAEIDFALIEKYRQKWNMFFRDRRVDAYAPIASRWLG